MAAEVVACLEDPLALGANYDFSGFGEQQFPVQAEQQPGAVVNESALTIAALEAVAGQPYSGSDQAPHVAERLIVTAFASGT